MTQIHVVAENTSGEFDLVGQSIVKSDQINLHIHLPNKEYVEISIEKNNVYIINGKKKLNIKAFHEIEKVIDRFR